MTETTITTTTELVGRTHVRATCSCGWKGPLNPTRFVGGQAIADHDAKQHAGAHAAGTGWFDFEKGWVYPEPTVVSVPICEMRWDCDKPAAGYIDADGDPILCCDSCAETETTLALIRWPDAA